MPANPRELPRQKVGSPVPGDLLIYQGADLGRLCLVVSVRTATGLADENPAWRVLLLTTRGELGEMLVHEATRGTTWATVKTAAKVE